MSSTVYSPLEGTLVSLEQVPDEAFSQMMMGEGVAIIPSKGVVCAPFDGTLEVLPDTKHALGLLSNDGVELLIHVGLETVELKGKYYTEKINEGDSYKKGDVLLEFDLCEIQANGYNIVTPITVTNMESYKLLSLCKDTIDGGTNILTGEKIFDLS